MRCSSPGSNGQGNTSWPPASSTSIQSRASANRETTMKGGGAVQTRSSSSASRQSPSGGSPRTTPLCRNVPASEGRSASSRRRNESASRQRPSCGAGTRRLRLTDLRSRALSWLPSYAPSLTASCRIGKRAKKKRAGCRACPLTSGNLQKLSLSESWTWRLAPSPTSLVTVDVESPKVPPAAANVKGWPG